MVGQNCNRLKVKVTEQPSTVARRVPSIVGLVFVFPHQTPWATAPPPNENSWRRHCLIAERTFCVTAAAVASLVG